MIDWDEVNWGKGIAIIVAGLIVVGAGIFLLNDYLRYQRLNELLMGQIEELDQFYSTWKPPSDLEMAQLRAKRDNLINNLRTAAFTVPESIDPGEIENTIREEAVRNAVAVSDVSFLAESSRGFFRVQPVQVSFTGDEEPVANFLRRLDQIPYVHQLEATRLTFGEVMNITINLFTFDKNSWSDFYKCKLKVTFPKIEDVDIERVKVFKGNLDQLKSQVNDKHSSLVRAKEAVNQECKIEGEIGALEEQIGLIQELTSE
jgi:Tfp pilus assembly protein PilO